MTLDEIKTVLGQGDRVYWSNHNYEVIYSLTHDEYYIHSRCNDYFMGLFHMRGNETVLNGKEEDFFPDIKINGFYERV